MGTIMERIKLGEICEIVSGSTPKTDITEYWDGNIDWITPAELTDETYIIRESQRKITHTAVQNTGLRPFPKDTVILSSRAPIGKVAIAGKEMYCNQGFKNLMCSDRIDHRYLYWYLKGHTDYLNALGRGATFKEISKKIVENIEIPLPSLDEQMKCSNILKKCWDLILVHKKQIELYDKLVKARFVEMFGDPIINEKRWKRVVMGDICEIGSSKRIFEKEYVASGVPFYRTKEIVELSRGCEISTELYITRERFEELKEKYGVPVENDLLISAVGTIGIIWVVDGKQDFYFKDGNLIKIDASTAFDSLYMKYLLEKLIENYKNKMSTGTAYSALTISGLKEMLAYDVPISLQKRFAAFAQQVERLKSTTKESLAKLQTLQKSLMQQYFIQPK